MSRAQGKRDKDDHEMANGCLSMIHDMLAHLGNDMSAVPPMFYNDCIESTLYRYVKRAHEMGAAGKPLADAVALFPEPTRA